MTSLIRTMSLKFTVFFLRASLSEAYEYIIYFSRGPEGHLKPPLWSLANIKCGAANIICEEAYISRIMAGILNGVPDILYVQHQFFKNFGPKKCKFLQILTLFYL